MIFGKATYRRETESTKSQKGSALITALIMSLVFAIIAGASLSRCLSTWSEIGRGYHRDSALHVAESGVEMAIWALNHRNANPGENINGLEGVLNSLRGTASGWGSQGLLTGTMNDPLGRAVGEYSAVITVDPNDVRRAFVTSTGTTPPSGVFARNRETRRVRVVLLREQSQGEIFGCAIYTPTWIDTNGITEIHGNVVAGNRIRSTANEPNPHNRVTQYTYEYWDEETQSVQTANGEVDEERNMDEDPDNDVVLPFDEFILENFKQMAIDQGYFFDSKPRASDLPSGFFQPDGVTPNVVFITTSIHLAGNYTFGGLIFVVGDIFTDELDAEFGGNHDIQGIIYTTGMFRTHGGGNRAININGGVFCGSANMQGNTVIEYEWTYFEALKNFAMTSNKFRFVSWQELPPPASNQ